MTQVFMPRNKSGRTVTSKQTSLMADQPPLSPTQFADFTKPTAIISSLFTSPKFKLFTSRFTPFDSDSALISPTSILDSNPAIFSSRHDVPNSCLEPTVSKPQRFQPPEALGLADLVNTAITDGSSSNARKGIVTNSTKPINKMVLFGSKLRVQIPSVDFGTKSGGTRYPGQGQGDSYVQTRVLNVKGVSVSEMELTEDYTCVISHGPNPTTVHIFDNCVFVETPPAVSPPPLGAEAQNRDNECSKTDSFLSFCYSCKKRLDKNLDIYIYRGEKAFCSSECRSQEMLIDETES